MPNEGVIPNPHPKWLPDSAWLQLVRVSQIFQLQGLMAHVREEGPAWEAWVASQDPCACPPPKPWDRLQGLEKTLLLRCLRPDAIGLQVRNFIQERLGQAFMQIPLFNLEASYEDSASDKPLIFILSPGADPLKEIDKLATSMQMKDKMQTLSLGQGQGPVAEQLVSSAVSSGGWVVLQNCHLAPNFMAQLTSIWEETIGKAETHPEFRLWLTSYPSSVFPTSMLQAGVKITIQRPQALKPCLVSFYQSDIVTGSDGLYMKGNDTLKRLLFGLLHNH